WLQRTLELRDQLDRARQLMTAEEYPPVAAPPAQRTFYLFVGEQDFQDRESYAAITADLRAVGRYSQVYVDRLCSNPTALQPTIDDTVRTFDEEIHPWARQQLGRVRDVDRDGRFTILLTPWLAKLQRGKVSLGGFVCGGDFDRDLAAPFGN